MFSIFYYIAWYNMVRYIDDITGVILMTSRAKEDRIQLYSQVVLLLT